MSSLTLLPLSPTQLEQAKCEVLAELQKKGLSPEEGEIQLEACFADWLDETETRLSESILQILDHASWFSRLERPRKSSPGLLYVRIVNRLSKQSRTSRRSAAITMSYLPLIIHLSQDFQISAAGISEILNKSDRRLLLHWKGIKRIFSELRMDQRIEESQFDDLIARDKSVSDTSFIDADVSTIIEILESESDVFELGISFRSSINELLMPDHGKAFVPYLQALFYLCVITEYYDHPLEYLYTFNPRGNVANAIFDVFPSVMASAGNPILNNFKAIDRLSYDWARSRDDYPKQANALVDIVAGLSSLSFGSRRYLAQKFRGALLKFIEIQCPEDETIPQINSVQSIRHSLDVISVAETYTKGVIEQRICDFLAQLIYPKSRWRSRGLCDPVNATNTSSMKLGDVDFQSVDERKCVAIEAHAGKLTSVYLKEHFRTLWKNLPRRMEEWIRIAELDEWTLEIVFVVHENACNSPGEVPEVSVSNFIKILTYREFIEDALSCSDLQDLEIVSLFNKLVIDVLNQGNTPLAVKQKMIGILSSVN